MSTVANPLNPKCLRNAILLANVGVWVTVILAAWLLF